MKPLRIVAILLVLGVAGTACSLYWDTQSDPHVGAPPDAGHWYPDAWLAVDVGIYHPDGGPYPDGGPHHDAGWYPDSGLYPDAHTNCGGPCLDAGIIVFDAGTGH